MSPVESISAVGISDDVHGSGLCPSDVIRRPLGARVLVAAVRAYQAARSGRPTGCRYLPTCSEYAVEAIDTHGTARGAVLAARRLARCTPWGGHGIDPVPDRRAQ
jgi:putative membrane protein insertion efficiency factor